MRLVLVPISIALCAMFSASPAVARYGFCLAQIPGRNIPIPNQVSTAYPSYLSDILDFGVGEEHSRAVGRQFATSIGQPQGATCYSHFADAEAAAYYKSALQQRQAGYNVETGWNGGYAASASVKRAPVSPAPDAPRRVTSDRPQLALAPSKYVEVAGPDGPIRLSPEVAARNQAAADDYRRKMTAFARAKAEHDRTLALHQQSQANAAAEKRDYEQKLAMNNTEVASHGAAMVQYAAATKPPAKGATGWMYCEARGEIGSKRRFYSTIAEVGYVPGQITIIDVMAKNRAAFKAYLSGTHKVFFGTDTLLHCPYSTDDLAEAQGYEARDKRGDGNNGIEIIQTGWVPTSG